jgi:hypothetical protein
MASTVGRWWWVAGGVCIVRSAPVRGRRRRRCTTAGRPASQSWCRRHNSVVVQRRRQARGSDGSRPHRGRCYDRRDHRRIHRPHPSPRFAQKITRPAVNSLNIDDSPSPLTGGRAEAESDPSLRPPARRPVFFSNRDGIDSVRDAGLKEAAAVAALGWGWRVARGIWVVRSAPIRDRGRWWRVAAGRPAARGRCARGISQCSGANGNARQ